MFLNRARRLANFKHLSFAELQKYLDNWKAPLKEQVSKITLTTTYFPRDSGARVFARDFLPSLQYHNPNVHWSRLKSRTATEPKLTIQMKDGSEQSIDAANLKARDIYDKLLEIGARQ